MRRQMKALGDIPSHALRTDLFFFGMDEVPARPQPILSDIDKKFCEEQLGCSFDEIGAIGCGTSSTVVGVKLHNNEQTQLVSVDIDA